MDTEESTNEKIVAETIHNEFCNADEPNLLKEEDMHVFEYRPLTDPLQLVCCNACKKPIKASQYSAHAARCGPLNSTSDDLELGGSNHLKPRRKGRKLSQTNNGKQENHVLIDGNHARGSASNSAVDAADISHGGAELKKESLTRREVLCSPSNKYQSATSSLEQFLASEAPAPLASKIYYSRGEHRIREELCYLFRESWTHDRSSHSSGPEQSHENGALPSHFKSSSKVLSGIVSDSIPQLKKDACNMGAVPSPDQILTQNSDMCSGRSRLPPTE